MTLLECRRDADRIMESWRNGRPADAAAAMQEHPEFALHRSLVIDLAYEEYLQRERAGQPPNPAEFARAFPEFQSLLESLLAAHVALVEEPELLVIPEEPWPVPGEPIHELIVKRELGSGSFGRAYLAEDPVLGRLRVVKVAKGGAAEARVIGGLSHPNVVDVLWSRPVGGRAAVCLPFVGAATLATLIIRADRHAPSAKQILDTTAASPDEPPDTRAKPVVFERDSDRVAAAAIGTKLARAIAYLHSRGVVHGDIKPTNVVLQPGGAPQVIDFNLAAGEAPAFAVRGTPAFMAPELLDITLGGPPVPVDGMKADIFALGVTLIELFTGRHPYRAPGNDNLAKLAEDLRRCDVSLPGWPAGIASLLKRCLAIAPSERPTAVDVANELNRFVASERSRGERRLRFLLGAAAALLLAGLVAGAVMKPDPDVERPPETASEYRTRGLDALHAGKADAARADFISAHERDRDPRDLALAAYCYAATGEQRVAVEWNKRAIEAGFDTAEVRNNRGASRLQLGSAEEALPDFDVALQKDGELRSARYGRAMARFRLALGSRRPELFPLAVADMNEVLKSGPESAELHADAGRLFAEALLLDRSLHHLERAVELGCPPTNLARDIRLKRHFANNPRFEAIVNSPARPPHPPVQLHFAEPR